MREAWRGPATVELVLEEHASRHDRERRAFSAAPRRARRDRSDRHLRAASSRPCALDLPQGLRRARDHGALPACTCSPDTGRPALGARRAHGRCAASASAQAHMSDTLVFIPAWNEEDNLPGVLGRPARGASRRRCARRRRRVDGRDSGCGARARGGGAFARGNRGLRVGIAEGYRWALEHGYTYCGRVDADGQHPAHELARLLALVRSASAMLQSGRALSRATAMPRTGIGRARLAASAPPCCGGR